MKTTTLMCLLAAAPLAIPTEAYAETVTATMQAERNILFGHVLNKQTGEYLIGATVRLIGTNHTAKTDSTGHYRLTRLPDSDATIEVSMPGFASTKQKAKLKGDRLFEVNFELRPNEVELSSVVVSANRIETKRRNAPSLVGVINNYTLENTNSVNLAQGLNFQSGVRVENNCQNCGLTQVRINGLDGHYSQVLIDSRPVFSSLTGVYGLEILPTSMIDRVEVVRGGGSALFGGSAIAGTINVITKTPSYNSASFSHTLGAYTDNRAFDNTTTFNAAVLSSNKQAGLAIFGQNRERQAYDHDGDGFTEKPKSSSQALGMRGFLNTSTYSKLGFEYHHLEESRRGGDSLHMAPHMVDIAEQAEYNINGGELTYSLFSPNGAHRFEAYAAANNSDRTSFYGGKATPKAYGRTHNLTYVLGAQYGYSMQRLFFAPAQFTAGSEYNYDYLTDKTLDNRNPIKQTMRNFGLFAQNEWKTQYVDILIGARLDKHNFIDRPIFSPRVNLKFKPMEDLSIRATYASGFRAPQTFDEDLHVSNVGGEWMVIENDANLKEERSHSFSFSTDYYRNLGDWQMNFILEGFYTRLLDAFALTDNKTVGNVKYMLRQNVNRATVAGIMAEAKLAYLNTFQLQAGLTVQSAKYSTPIEWEQNQFEDRILRTPSTYGYITATYKPAEQWSIALSGVYTGQMYVPHYTVPEIKKTPSFFDLGIKVTRDFRILNSTDLQINAGVKNIFNAFQKDFDKGAERDSKYIYGPNDPRTIVVGMKLSL